MNEQMTFSPRMVLVQVNESNAMLEPRMMMALPDGDGLVRLNAPINESYLMPAEQVFEFSDTLLIDINRMAVVAIDMASASMQMLGMCAQPIEPRQVTDLRVADVAGLGRAH